MMVYPNSLYIFNVASMFHVRKHIRVASAAPSAPHKGMSSIFKIILVTAPNSMIRKKAVWCPVMFKKRPIGPKKLPMTEPDSSI